MYFSRIVFGSEVRAYKDPKNDLFFYISYNKTYYRDQLEEESIYALWAY